MSTTTGSPGWMTRPVAPWWGLAPFGPEATMAKSNLSWPCRGSPPRCPRPAPARCARRAATSPIRPCTPSIAAAGPAQRRRPPRGPCASAAAGDGRGAERAGRRQRRLEPQQEGAPQLVAGAQPPAGGPGRGQGLDHQPAPGRRSPARRPPRSRARPAGRGPAAPPGPAPPAARRRPPARHQQGQPLQVGQVVAGQVGQVGRRPQQQRVDPPLGLLLARPGETFGPGRGGCRHRAILPPVRP